MVEIDFKPEGCLIKQGNSFYIYDQIDKTFLEKIHVPFLEEIKLQEKLKNGVIKIYINSDGGDVMVTKEFLSAIELAKDKGIEVETYVMSRAASAATLIAVAGTKRYVTKGSKQLIHYPMGLDWKETVIQSENNVKDYKYEVKLAVDHYNRYCDIPDLEDKLSEGNHIIYGGTLLKKYGLADFII